MDTDGNPWKKPLKTFTLSLKQIHERTVLLTVRLDLGTQSSLSGCDVVIRILKVYHKNKNKTENFLFLGRNISNSFH